METWDLYDSNRIYTGRSMQRGDSIQHGFFHLVVHVCIFNATGRMLIQQRQPFKEGWGDFWDVTVGGSALSGETSQMAAEREVREEIGIDLLIKDQRPSLTINFDAGFDDFYLVKHDIEINKLSLQYEEVKEVKWASYDEIICMIDRGTFIPYHKALIDLLFTMHLSGGALQAK
jgi:isopentenyldiphosphate isomerase